MPNYQAIAEQMVKEEAWTHEGETSDGTQLVSCPKCGAVVPEYLKLKHAHWHAVSAA